MELKYSAEGLLEDGLKVLSERGQQYDPKGKTERSMEKIVAAFKIITGKELTEAEGWMFMAVLKQVRSFQRPGFHADSAQDFVCYSALYGEAKAKEGGPQGEILSTPDQWKKRAALTGLGYIQPESQRIREKEACLDQRQKSPLMESYLSSRLSEEARRELRQKAYALYKQAATALQVRCSSSWAEMHPTEQRAWLTKALGQEPEDGNMPILDPTERKKDPDTGLDLPAQ